MPGIINSRNVGSILRRIDVDSDITDSLKDQCTDLAKKFIESELTLIERRHKEKCKAKFYIDFRFLITLRNDKGETETVIARDTLNSVFDKLVTYSSVEDYVSDAIDRILQKSEEVYEPGTGSGFSVVSMKLKSASGIRYDSGLIVRKYFEAPDSLKLLFQNINTDDLCFWYSLILGIIWQCDRVSSEFRKKFLGTSSKLKGKTYRKLHDARELLNGFTLDQLIEKYSANETSVFIENIDRIAIDLEINIRVLCIDTEDSLNYSLLGESRTSYSETINVCFLCNGVYTHCVYISPAKIKLLTKRGPNKRFICSECGYTSTSEKCYNDHMARHKGIYTFKLEDPENCYLRYQKVKKTYKGYMLLKMNFSGNSNELVIDSFECLETHVKVNSLPFTENIKIYIKDLKKYSEAFINYLEYHNVPYSCCTFDRHYATFEVNKCTITELSVSPEQFMDQRMLIKKCFGIDTLNYNSVPSMAFHAMMKYIKEPLRLFNSDEYDIAEFMKNSFHKAICYCPRNYVKADLSKGIYYIDFTSLYPTAGTYSLPVGNWHFVDPAPFTHEFIKNYSSTHSEKGYLLEFIITKTPSKTIEGITGFPESHTVEHISVVRVLLNHGYCIKVIKVLEFDQKPILCKYFNKLNKMRISTKNEIFKLFSNSTWGVLGRSPKMTLSGITENNEKNVRELFRDPTLLKGVSALDDYKIEYSQYNPLSYDHSPRALFYSIHSIARSIMIDTIYKLIENVPDFQLIYSNTDSLIFKCNNSDFKKIKGFVNINDTKKLGSVKLEGELSEIVVLSRGVYAYKEINNDSESLGSNLCFDDYLKIYKNNESIVDYYTSVVNNRIVTKRRTIS